MMTRMPYDNTVVSAAPPPHFFTLLSIRCLGSSNPRDRHWLAFTRIQWRALGRRKLRCAYRIGFAGGDERLLQQAAGEEDRQSKRRRQTYRARVIRRTV